MKRTRTFRIDGPTVVALLLLVSGTGALGYGLEQTDGWWIAGAFGLAFLGYGLVLVRSEASDWTFWWWVGVGLRVGLVFAFPALSDDIYRFIWDGHLIVAGLNPFEHLPAYYLEPEHAVPGLTPELYAALNSPEYYTIYPPVAQGVFAAAVVLSPQSWFGSMLVMKLFLVGCELGTLWLLPRVLERWSLPPARSLLYALNPLILVEISGNLHFEGAMVFGLVLAMYWLQGARWALAAVAFAFSIAGKLLSLLFLPFLLFRLKWKENLVFFGILGMVLLLSFAPLMSGFFFRNFGDSLDLYFRKFEFNASLYYLARFVGYQWTGYNQIAFIGPMLAGIAAVGILAMALLEQKRSWEGLPQRWLFAIVLYLLCTTTVHPWYLSLPIVLCLFTRWRFPVVWSALIPLTYVGYAQDPFQEQVWLVGMEYTIWLWVLMWELKGKGTSGKAKR